VEAVAGAAVLGLDVVAGHRLAELLRQRARICLKLWNRREFGNHLRRAQSIEKCTDLDDIAQDQTAGLDT